MSKTITFRSRVIDLDEYDICPYFGFISCESALLPALNEYFSPWNTLLDRLADLLSSKRFRKEARALPLLSITRLRSSTEARRAYVSLASFVQAWVFEDVNQPEAVVPPAISQPFIDICAYWGLQPALTHAGCCLWNWKLKDNLNAIQDSPVEGQLRLEMRTQLLESLDDFQLCSSFTGTDDEKVFNMIPLLIEAEGGFIVNLMLDALVAVETDAADVVAARLTSCLKHIEAMPKRLSLLNDRCNPQVFFHKILPYISPSKGMEENGLPDGFIFQLANGDRVYSKCAGAGAAQSSLFHFIDRVFGIEHNSQFLKDMRSHMPQKHRQFLQLIESMPNLRQFVQARPDHAELREAFDNCIRALREWRTKHIGLSVRYLMLPEKAQSRDSGLKATCGSSPLPFLKQTRNDTA